VLGGFPRDVYFTIYIIKNASRRISCKENHHSLGHETSVHYSLRLIKRCMFILCFLSLVTNGFMCQPKVIILIIIVASPKNIQGCNMTSCFNNQWNKNIYRLSLITMFVYMLRCSKARVRK